MATQASLDQIQNLYIAFYGRPADLAGQTYWADELEAANGDLTAIIDAFASSEEYDSQYGDLTNEELVNALYQQILGRDAEQEGLDYYVGELEAGNITKGGIALAILDGATGDDAATMANRKDVADAFTAAVEASDKEYGDDQLAAAKALLAGVDADTDPATVDVYAVVSDFPDAGEGPTEPVEGETQYLAVDQDILTGTDGDDTFNARVAQNMLGAQVNTLGSGDVIDGGAGNDTLMAKVTAGLFGFNDDSSDTMAIQPETTSVENILIEAVESQSLHTGSDSSEVGNTTVVINAKDLLDVQEIGSYRSDADLLIQNLTTKNSEDGTNMLSDMTVSMAYTGNADSQWGASDLTVYFDQDYLVPEGTRTNPIVDFLAMNEDNYDATNGERPLDGVFFRQLEFTLNGVEFDLTPYLGEDENGTGSEITTYQEFLAAVQQALIQLKAANPDNDALQSVTAQFGRDFTTDVNPETLELREGIAIRLTVDGLTNGSENTLSVEATDLEVARAAGATVPNNNRYEIADDEPPVEGSRLSINVDLEKVGLAGDGGQLIIGSMNKTSDNEWGAVDTVVDGTTSGIEEFNVTVYGNDTKSSSLAGLHSTNNNLRVITVATDENQTGSYANLTIGNSNSDGAGVKDIQTIDASAFKGDLSVTAAITDEVTAKYMDLQDEDAPAADNVEFSYTGGEGDDTFVIGLDSSNLSNAGTTTREDFELTVDGGDGDDLLILGIASDAEGFAQGGNNLDDANFFFNSVDEAILENWYDNSTLNANLTLNGGAGNDTIWTPGSGNVVINAGTGNDTVYADNTGAYPSGRMAVWAFNVEAGDIVERENIDNLQSDENDSYTLFRSNVVVDFKGFEVEVELDHNNGVVTDLQINQAIKEAINSDDVLSKLLVAEDGPANTLVVRSLIDGAMEPGDLTVSLEAPESLTAGEVQQLQSWLGLTGQTEASLISLIEDQIAIFDEKGDYAENYARHSSGAEYIGVDSDHTSDNIITGGTGDDVLVLGTGELSNDTVVYEGFGNGTDTIVNFDTGNETETVVTTVTSGRIESFTVNFSDVTATGTGATLEFDGITINIADASAGLIPAEDIALAFTEQYTGGNWSVTGYSAGDTSITLVNTSTAATPDTTNVQGNVDPNVVAGDFVFTTATGSVTITDYVEGLEAESYNTDATAATFTLDFDPNGLGTDVVATTDGTIDYFGATISYTAGDGAITLAQAFANASYTDFTAVLGADGTTVLFTATTPGAAVVADALGVIDEATNGVDPVVSSTAVGADAVTGGGTYTTTTVTPVGDAGMDYLDFSDYGVTAVYVDGVLVAGSAPSEDSDLYVTLTESATNAGEYTMRVVDSGENATIDATDSVVGVIGVADFGETQSFIEDNFII